MKIKSQKDFWSGVMFVCAGVGFAVGALNYSFGSSARPGPAYFPFGLGVLMAILGALLLFASLTVETEDGEPIEKTAWRPLLIIVGSIALFGWTLPHFGMILGLPLLVITSSLAGDQFHWGEVIMNSVILTLGSWAIFIWGLNLTMPLWPTIFAAGA
ncbi:MAG: tripartite tricarboxylate transporter TctB family protein [Burkholderiales bacterium]